MDGTGARGAIPTRNLVMLAALVIVWGSHWPIMKFALAEIPLFSFRAFCVVFGAAGLFLIARLRGHSLAVPRAQWRGLVLASVLNISGWFYGSALALTLMPASRATIIAYTMPLFTFLLGIPVLKQRPTRGQWLGLALGLAGVALLVGEDMMTLREAPLGAAAMFFAAMSFGCGAVVQKRVQWETSLLAVTGWQLAIGGIPLVVAAIVVDQGSLGDPSWLAVGALSFTVLFGVIFGITTWLHLIAALPVQVASVSILLVPILGVFLSALLLGEQIGVTELAALTLVVAAVSRVVPLPRLRVPFRRRP